MLIEMKESVAERGINPEVYVDRGAIKNFHPSKVEETAEFLLKRGISFTLHAPYMDLNLGARDEDIRRISLKRVIDGINLALPFRPKVVVCHPGYFDYNYSFNYKVWMEHAYRSFSEIVELCEKHNLKVAIENVFERNPDNIAELLEKLPRNIAGFCFDPGHANLFSEIEITEWLTPFSGRVFEVHLHDNHGKVDEHLPIGDGNIPFDRIFKILEKEKPVFTLEPHKVEHLERSIKAFLNTFKRV